VLAIVEPAVRGQVHFAMHGDDGPVTHDDRRVVELCTRTFLDQPEHRPHRARCTRDRSHDVVVLPQGHA